MNSNATKSLVIRLVKGDETAFRLIYDRYWSRLYALCFYYTQSREETEDMLMDIFSSLWNNKEQIDIEYLEPYLVKAAKNQSLKYIQKRQRRRISIQKLKERTAAVVPEFDQPDKMLEMKELADNLHCHIESLPEKTKKIFLLNRNNGLTYEQIASTLNISEKAVEYHISKALRLLTSHALILLTILLLK